MATVLITGGTGMIGTALTSLLRKHGHDVIILSRDPMTGSTKAQPKISADAGSDGAAVGTLSFAKWDVKNQTIDADAIKRADHIVHLAGANVAEKRWTNKRKKEILESRTMSAALVVKGLKENPNKVKTVVSASGIGWYGPDTLQSLKNGGFVETDPASDDYLGTTCVQWENSIQPVTGMGKRLVLLRTGIVLDKNDGAIKEFKKPLNGGVAAILGNGKQIISWIHIDDICRLYLYAITNESLNGVYNAVANEPVSNKTFVIELAKKMRGKFYLPVYVPAFALRMVLGEMSIEVLKSAYVNNLKIRHAGFKFVYPTLEAAMNAMCGSAKVINSE